MIRQSIAVEIYLSIIAGTCTSIMDNCAYDSPEPLSGDYVLLYVEDDEGWYDFSIFIRVISHNGKTITFFYDPLMGHEAYYDNEVIETATNYHDWERSVLGVYGTRSQMIHSIL